MKLLYFAWLKTRTGRAEEDVAPPDGIATVGALVDWLKTRGPGYASAFAEMRAVRAAVNQEYVGLDHPVRPGDEVAFFSTHDGRLRA